MRTGVDTKWPALSPEALQGTAGELVKVTLVPKRGNS
jgi:hypothetical protein